MKTHKIESCFSVHTCIYKMIWFNYLVYHMCINISIPGSGATRHHHNISPCSSNFHKLRIFLINYQLQIIRIIRKKWRSLNLNQRAYICFRWLPFHAKFLSVRFKMIAHISVRLFTKHTKWFDFIDNKIYNK